MDEAVPQPDEGPPSPDVSKSEVHPGLNSSLRGFVDASTSKASQEPLQAAPNHGFEADNHNRCSMNFSIRDDIMRAEASGHPAKPLDDKESATSFCKKNVEDRVKKKPSIDLIPNDAIASSPVKPTLSLDQLPTELLENIGLALPAKSITELKCVNKYLYEVFNADRMWRKYLLYPERYFKSELKSGSSAPKVVKVVEEISAGAMGKWQGYYKLQQARLQTWLSGEIDAFKNKNEAKNLDISTSEYSDDSTAENSDDLTAEDLDDSIPEDLEDCIDLICGERSKNILDMQEMVDHDGQRWLFFLTGDIMGNSNVSICNITKRSLEIDTVSFSLVAGPTSTQLQPVWVHEIMALMPEGRVLLMMELMLDGPNNGDFVAVYQFQKPDYKMNLLFKIVPDLDVCFRPSETIPEHIKNAKLGFAVVGDLFVACAKDCVPDLSEVDLNVWNFKTGTKIANVCLSETPLVQQFRDFIGKPDTREDPYRYCVQLYPGPSASVIVILNEAESERSQVYIFDLKTLEFSALVLKACNILDCHVFEDKVCVVEVQSEEEYVHCEGFFDYRPAEYLEVDSSVSIYSVKKKSEPKLLKSVDSRPSYKIGKGCRELNNRIIFNNSKVLVQGERWLSTESFVQIVSLDTDPMEVREVNVEKGFILSFIEPNLLLLYDKLIIDESLLPDDYENYDVCFGKIQVINTLNGSPLCKWRTADYGKKLSKYYKSLRYPSKVVFCNDDKLDLFASI